MRRNRLECAVIKILWRKLKGSPGKERNENENSVCIEVNEERRTPETGSISGRKNGNVAKIEEYD